MTDLINHREFNYFFPVHWAAIGLLGWVVAWFVYRVYCRERGTGPRSVRMVLFAIRLTVVSIVLLSVLNWYVVTKKFRKPELVFLFDNSASLLHLDALNDAEAVLGKLKEQNLDLPTRLNLMKLMVTDLEDQWESLSEKFEFVFGRFGNKLEVNAGGKMNPGEFVAGLDAKAYETHINSAVKSVFRQRSGKSTAAIVLFTDGVDSQDLELRTARQLARSESIPIYVVGLGNRRPAKDFSLDEVTVNDRVFLNDLVEFEVNVAANGLENRNTTVRLVDQQTGKVLVEKRIELKSNSYRSRVRLQARMSEAGKRDFLVKADVVESELDFTNNQLSATVDVRNDPIRVLLVSDYPSREFHYLKQFLGRNSTSDRDAENEFSTNRVDLDTFLQQGDVEYASTDRHAINLFPVNKQQLFEYDVVILGDVKPNWAGATSGGLGQSELEHLRQFVEVRGGGLILLAGPKHNPRSYADSLIADLFPISLKNLLSPLGDDLDQEFRWRQSSFGKRFLPMEINAGDESSKQFSEFPGAFWFQSSASVKDGARILAVTDWNGQSIPVVVLQTIGNGSVLYHAMPASYRWRFREGDKYFGRYWSQMIQYLAAAKLATNKESLQLDTDRQQYFRGDSVTFLLTAFDRNRFKNDAQITLLIRSIGGKEKKVELRRKGGGNPVFEGVEEGLSPGSYFAQLAEVDDVQTRFEIADASQENKRRPINQKYLQLLAEQSGGAYLTVDDLDQLVDRLPDSAPIEVGGEPPWILWHHWEFTSLLGGLLMALLSAEWIIRKKFGML